MNSNLIIKPKIIFIAGSDNIGGAGIQADFKVATRLNCHSASVFTCITAQDFDNVYAFLAIEKKLFSQQLCALNQSGLDFNYLKISLLPTTDQIDVVAAFLIKNNKYKSIIDTVFVKNKSKMFLDKKTIKYLEKKVFSLATVVSCNRNEFAILINKEVADFTVKNIKQDIITYCKKQKISRLILRSIKKENNIFTNIFFLDGEFIYFDFKELKTENLHGTGCVFTAAFICYLALNSDDFCKAFKLASRFACNAVAKADHENKYDKSLFF